MLSSSVVGGKIYALFLDQNRAKRSQLLDARLIIRPVIVCP
jgi:hypothetical protein